MWITFLWTLFTKLTCGSHSFFIFNMNSYVDHFLNILWWSFSDVDHFLYSLSPYMQTLWNSNSWRRNKTSFGSFGIDHILKPKKKCTHMSSVNKIWSTNPSTTILSTDFCVSSINWGRNIVHTATYSARSVDHFVYFS